MAEVNKNSGIAIADKNSPIHNEEFSDQILSYLKSNGLQVPQNRLDRDSEVIEFLGEHDLLFGDVDRQIESIIIADDEGLFDKYFEIERKKAKEQGLGDIIIGEDQKKEMIEAIRNDQRTSLKTWAEYLGGNELDYPDWFRYYVWESVKKLGPLDIERKTFNRRDKSTYGLFPELNAESLSKLFDSLQKHRVEGVPVDDARLKELLTEGNFRQLYSHFVAESLNQKESLGDIRKGVWRKFYRSDNPEDSDILALSLDGHNTGWCTAGKEMAHSQLSQGDFYVYYTEDSKGEFTIPRLAIRMHGEHVSEARGILSSQNVEEEALGILDDKLQELPGGDSFKTNSEDMRRVTEICRRINEDPNSELTDDEYLFIYNPRHIITGFGYIEDPRVSELKKTHPIPIGPFSRLVVDYKIDVWEGDLDLSHLTTAEGLVLPYKVVGLLNLSGLTTAEGLVLPQEVGSLYLSGLTTAKGLELPQEVWLLDLSGLTTAEGLVLPKKVRSLNLSGLTTAKGLELPQDYVGTLDLSGLTTAEGVKLPQKVGNLDLRSLTTADGLVLPQDYVVTLNLSGLTTAEGLVLPQEEVGTLDLSGLTTAEGVKLPQKVGNLDLRSLTTAEGVILPQEVGSLDLSGLTTAKGLVLPKKVVWLLDLSGLTTAKGLELPQEVGNLDLSGLTTAKGLVLPQDYVGDLDLRSLTTVDGVKFPKKVFSLNLSGLTTAEGLVLPQEEVGSLNLSGLRSINGFYIDLFNRFPSCTFIFDNPDLFAGIDLSKYRYRITFISEPPRISKPPRDGPGA